MSCNPFSGVPPTGSTFGPPPLELVAVAAFQNRVAKMAAVQLRSSRLANLKIAPFLGSPFR